MRIHGTLTKWNDERGFGFISQGSREIFVHISAFPRDGVRPTLNELVSFETESGPGGKIRAVRVMRPAGARESAAPRRLRGNHAPRRRSAGGLAFLILATLGIFAYARFHDQFRPSPFTGTPQPRAGALLEQPSQFRCDGRTQCPQMRSCAEAEFFLANCPNTKMDGDGDGRPCEQQWCNY
ncbi:MAG: cold shock domain-containing protein [Rhodanobacteraceae bacterium]|nr:cold shock domain-containing protein [Rhodanobacteraceae bacterium]